MTNFLYAQAPNRKGNESKHPAKHESVGGGVKMATPKGSQGAAKASGNAYPVGNKVSVSTPKPYCTKTDNDGYMNSDRNNYLK